MDTPEECWVVDGSDEDALDPVQDCKDRTNFYGGWEARLLGMGGWIDRWMDIDRYIHSYVHTSLYTEVHT